MLIFQLLLQIINNSHTFDNNNNIKKKKKFLTLTYGQEACKLQLKHSPEIFTFTARF